MGIVLFDHDNWAIILCNLQIACPFQNKRCTFSKTIKVLFSLRNAQLFLSQKDVVYLLIRKGYYTLR